MLDKKRFKIFIKKYLFHFLKCIKLKGTIVQKIIPQSKFLEYSYSSKNISKIKKLKNLHFGKRAFLIGMGPSLKIEDLDRLKQEITFACNKVYLSFDKTKWRPTYYSVSDTLVAQNNFEIINNLDLFKILRDDTSEFLKSNDKTIWLRDLRFQKENSEALFSDKIDIGVFRGGTVLFMQMQLAVYMGIKEIYIIGADYSFIVPEGTGEKSNVGEIVINQDQQNHFHPDYRKKGESWAKPNMDMQQEAFQAAFKYAQKHNIKIFNASRATKLEVFPKVNFDELFD